VPDFPILPSTKIGALLARYPELEDVLIGLAPPFKKLKNPFLRRGVAKVASLQQAAAVGRMPVGELVNRLRAAVGQDAFAVDGAAAQTDSYFSEKPAWFNAANIAASIDERSGDPNKMPITVVLQAAARLRPAEILELITTFLPAPGIGVMKGKGLLVWSVQESPELIRTYVSKPSV
jgi:Domain of unknown function (DUF1858)